MRRPSKARSLALGIGAVMLFLAAAWFFMCTLYWGWVSATPDAGRLSATVWGNLYCAATPIAVAGSIWCFALASRRWRWKGKPGVCAECGYDRRGLATDAACPECGTVPIPIK